MNKYKTNKDGSITITTTYSEEQVIPAEEVEAYIASKKSQLEYLTKQLEAVEDKYAKLKEQEVTSLKNTIEEINLELNSL
jgi:hypothetical protein